MKHFLRISIILASALFIYSCTGADPGDGTGNGNDNGNGNGGNDDRKTTCELQSLRIEAGRNNMNLSINFNINSTAGTATATVTKWIAKTDPEFFIPTFTHNGEQALVNGEPIESTRTKLSFAEEFSLVIVAESGKAKTYTVNLICPQINTELPVLRLEPERAVTDKENYVKTTLTMYSAKIPSGWWSEADGKIEMRGRGNSTWGDADKKPYRLKFPVKYSPLGLDHAREKSWVLLASDSDKSFMRNEIGWAFSRVLFNASEGYHHEKAVLFTPCSQFVNVYMHNDYIGIYQMSDHMGQGDGRIAVEKLEASDGSDANLITGGHILETDIHGNSAPERFRSGTGIQINHKYPDSDDFHTAQYQYIENFVNQTESVLFGSNFTDPVNGWRKYLDEKTLADFIIMKEFAGDADGYTSTYMYKRRGVEKLFFGPGWDFDKGCDNEWRVDHSNPVYSLMIDVGFKMPGNNGKDWFQRLWEDAGLRSAVKARWTARKGELKAEAFRVLNTKPAAMKNSVKANFTVWDWNTQQIYGSKPPAANYDAELARIRSFIDTRAAELDRLFR